MSARQATLALMQQLRARGISLSFDEVNTLRRAELTLQRWAEWECGDSNNYYSWVLVRDEVTGKPFAEVHQHSNGTVRRDPVADKEAGALRRVKAICNAHNLKEMSDAQNLYFYHQTDPRGCALYISNEPLQDNNYTRGIACCS